jgi:uncharacterized membrane protein YjjP (DUF1212 family)
MQESSLSKINFIMLTAKALHHYGASADRIENALLLMSEKFEVKADFFSIPTGLFASFHNKNHSQHTRLIRLAPGKINLEKLFFVDQIVDMVLDGKLSISEGKKSLESIFAQQPRFGTLATTFSYALIAGAVAIFINGTWVDCAISSLLGLFIGVFSESVKVERIDSIFEGIIAFIISLFTYFAIDWGAVISSKIVIMASLIYLIPGLGITTAMYELASQNLTSGTARFMGAVMVLLKITFGIYVATILAQYLNLNIMGVQGEKPEQYIKFIALFVAVLGLIVAFQVRPRDGLWVMIICFISFYSSQFLFNILGNPASSFLAGAIVGALANIFSRLLNRPALIFLLPALLLLVPGSIGLQSFNFMFAEDTIFGVKYAFSMLSVAIALVSGLYFGNVLIKPRRHL